MVIVGLKKFKKQIKLTVLRLDSFKGPVACILPLVSRVWVYRSGKSRFES